VGMRGAPGGCTARSWVTVSVLEAGGIPGWDELGQQHAQPVDGLGSGPSLGHRGARPGTRCGDCPADGVPAGRHECSELTKMASAWSFFRPCGVVSCLLHPAPVLAAPLHARPPAVKG
jgi:hypothetical protein